MLHKLREFIHSNSLMTKQHKLLLAVSGGVDSMVLLHLLLKEGYNVSVAHCNFQLRAKESDADEQFVKKICVEKKVPFFCKKFLTAKQAAADKTGIQETARKLRYEWFEELIEQHLFDRLVTAHQATDQLETILLNLSRGTGLNGLEGIKVQSGKLVRPLLFATRKEIENFALKNKIRFREDSSNASDKYARNRIRLHVLPELLHINPQAVEHIRHTSEVVQQANEFINAEISKWVKKHSKVTLQGISIEIAPIIKHKAPGFLLFHVLNRYGFNKEQVMQILAAIQNQSGKIFRTASFQLLKDRKTLFIQSLEKPLKEPSVFLIEKTKGSISTDGFEMKWKVKKVPSNLIVPNGKVFVDITTLRFPLTLRLWKKGDRFQPLGMKGKKKLSDFFVDQKLSRA
ncbi:MAG: tRNA lysidine(34) synthetase TilS, partial [Bacteroidia bacterium]|nr:tRNA lysidine(34) synthetase TilS [Bacteroidia bacterium]